MNIDNGNLSFREQELLDWVLFLLDLLNRYSVFFGLINRDVAWLNQIWEQDDIKSRQDKMVDFLQKEYDLPLNKVTNREVLEGKNE